MLVCWVEGEDGFDALTFLANDTIPVIATRRGTPGERQRLSIAHELAHLLLQPEEGVDKEKAAQRFAGALLAPAEAMIRELGQKRRRLDLRELLPLKAEYGLSMAALACRAHQLDIIDRSTYKRLCVEIRRRGWHKSEPEPLPAEEPKAMRRMVTRLVAEQIISLKRAKELLGEDDFAELVPTGPQDTANNANTPKASHHRYEHMD